MSDDAKDVPPKLLRAAVALAALVQAKVYLTQKHGGGVISIPGEYWGISLEQDMYDGQYVVYPDGKIKETEQYT